MRARHFRGLVLGSVLAIALVVPAGTLGATAPSPTATASLTIDAKDCSALVWKITVTWDGFRPNDYEGIEAYLTKGADPGIAWFPIALKDDSGSRLKGKFRSELSRDGYLDNSIYGGGDWYAQVYFGLSPSFTVAGARSNAVPLPLCQQ